MKVLSMFPNQEDLKKRLENAGFKSVKFYQSCLMALFQFILAINISETIYFIITGSIAVSKCYDILESTKEIIK